MKTIQRTITKTVNKLHISYDHDTESPRESDNLGYFITIDSKYNSPDNHPELAGIIKSTGDEATSQTEHMELITKEYNTTEQIIAIYPITKTEQIIAIYPITKYEHGNVSYSLGTTRGFDCSNNGFYIVTDKTAKALGTPPESFERVITQELNTYNKYVNGEIYIFVLYDDNGDVADSCGGFYDMEDIKEHLPEEWKDETLSDYITY